MNSKINSQLLESLIKFDFFFLKSTYQSRLGYKQLKLGSFSKRKNYCLITPSILLKNFKQFIRILSFLNKNKIHLNIVNFNNDFYLEIFKVLCKNKNISSKSLSLKKKIDFNDSRFKNSYFFFDKKVSYTFYKKMFEASCFLSVEFNDFLKNNDFGTYQVFSSFDDWKKIVFIFLIINFIYLDNKNYAKKPTI